MKHTLGGEEDQGRGFHDQEGHGRSKGDCCKHSPNKGKSRLLMFLTPRRRAGRGRTHGVFARTRPLKVIILTRCQTDDARWVDAPEGVPLATVPPPELSSTMEKHNKLKTQQCVLRSSPFRKVDYEIYSCLGVSYPLKEFGG